MSRTDEKQTYVVSRRGSQIFSFLLNGSKAVEIHCDACREDSILDEIYIGKVQNIVKNISAAFVEIAPGTVCYLPLEDLKHPVYTKKGTSHNIQQGDELLVQVKREGIKTKAPAVTTNLTLHGKYALLTTGNTQISVSSKLPKEEKERLLRVVKEYESEARSEIHFLNKDNEDSIYRNHCIQNREKICYALSKEIKAVEKQILLQKAKILKIKKDIYIYEQSTEIRGRYERYAMISIEQGHEPIDYRELNNCRCELEAAEQALENLQCNIYEIINREMRDATEKAEYIRCNNGIFLTLIRSIYSNADFLYRVISSSSGKYKLYIYKDMNFVLPEELPIDFKNDEEHTNYKKRCNNNTQIPNNQSKVHIVSWFSKKAHLDKNILRKEYRILSKQYHPYSKNAKSDRKTFSDISNEYNKILKNI